MSEPNYDKEAMENAKDMVKLLITLSTGIVVFSGTFFKDILQNEVLNPVHIYFLMFSWLSLVISIFFGVIIGYGRIVSLLRDHSYNTKDTILSLSVIFQEIFFMLGVVLFGIYILISL